MTSGDYVDVNGARADAAAAALEGLRNVLAQQVPGILSAITDLQSLGAAMAAPAPLTGLAGRAPADAAQMRAAADLAARMRQLTPGAVNPVTEMITLNEGWSGPGLGEAAARADVALLAAAQAGRVDQAKLAIIAEVAKDVADHQGNASYLTAFWSAPGAGTAVAGLAGTLNQANGSGADLLTSSDEHLLATFASSLAAATAKPGLLSTAAAGDLVQQFARAPDLWSAAMLFQYGPSGKAYGTATGAQVLAAVTRAVFNAREHGQYAVPLNVTQLRLGPYGMLTPLRTYDPLQAMLVRCAQDQAAAALVLGEPGGIGYAQDLLATPFSRYLYDPFVPPGGSPVVSVSPNPNARPQGPDVCEFELDQAAVGAFLYAATADHASSTDAHAVVNIVAANSKVPIGETFSQPVMNALLKIADCRAPDFAAAAGLGMYSTNPNGTGLGSSYSTKIRGAGIGTVIPLNHLAGYPVAIPDLTQLHLFLRRITATPQDAGPYLASVQAKLSLAVKLQVLDKGTPWVTWMGALEGMTQTAIGSNGFQNQENLLTQNIKEQEYSLALTQIVGAIPLADVASGTTLAFLRLTQLGIQEGRTLAYAYGPADTADPAAALYTNSQAFIQDKSDLKPAIVQGLIHAGLLKPAPDIYHNGHVVTGPALEELFAGTADYGGKPLYWWYQQALTGVEAQQG